MNKRLIVSGICVFAALAIGGQGFAASAVFITGGFGGTRVADSVHGWEFTVNQDITVTHLGLWDQDEDGIEIDHPIGVFRLSDEMLLTSGTINVGTGDLLIDGFRYIDTPDVILSAAESYVISYYTSQDDTDFVVTAATGEVFHPDVNWVAGRWGPDAGGLAIPPNSTSEDRYGPNFLFDAVSVPAISGLRLAILALSLLTGSTAVLLWRRRSAA